jgi:hypothetical protein
MSAPIAEVGPTSITHPKLDGAFESLVQHHARGDLSHFLGELRRDYFWTGPVVGQASEPFERSSDVLLAHSEHR